MRPDRRKGPDLHEPGRCEAYRYPAPAQAPAARGDPVNGYRWRGQTPRHEAARQWADAQWEHDQRVKAQALRRGRAAPEAPSPASGAAQAIQPRGEAA